MFDRVRGGLSSVPLEHLFSIYIMLLRSFRVHPMKLRFGESTANGYTTRMFADAWSRYVPRSVEQRNTPNNDGKERDP